MATRKTSDSLRYGPNGASKPTRKQLESVVMETYPDTRSGLPFATIANRIGELYAPGALKAHTVRGVLYQDREEISREYELCMRAIPDMKIKTGKPRFRKGNIVEVDWVLTGTHTGDFRGVPPSGKRVRIEGREVFHMRGTLIERHEVFTNYDRLGWNGIIVGAKPPKEPLFPKKETGNP